MGHYDSCYAHDDFRRMSQKEKETYYPEFEKEILTFREISRTVDDVTGYILAEWGRNKNYRVISFSSTVSVFYVPEEPYL